MSEEIKNEQNISKDKKPSLSNLGSVFNELVSTKKLDNEIKAIDVKHLNFFIKRKQILKDVSFSVNAGEIHGFLGPNGAGKTTTIKNIINAYVSRKKGSHIKIMGIDNKRIKAKTKYAYIPEYTAFPDHLNLTRYLKAMAKFSGIPSSIAEAKAIQLISKMGLMAHSKENPNNFSSGMKKKVLLAQALMTDPEVLIMDEPAANLDPAARNMLFKSLRELSKTGIAIFISSHVLAEMEGLVDSITLINNGSILYTGSVEEMQSRIQSPETILKIYSDKHEELYQLLKKYNYEQNVNYIRVFCKEKSEAFEIMNEISTKKIEIKKIEFDYVSLQDIYDTEFGT